ncbi:MAG: universal stress protein, partial [Deltaproteobacteria bacterium]
NERRVTKMYKSILVPLDGSSLAEAILPEIEKVAACMKAQLILLRVSRAHVFPGMDPIDAEVDVVRKAEEYLDGIAKQLSHRGFEVEVHVRYGDVADEILSHSKRNEVDLIAMSTHGRSGLGRWLLGSVAEKIVRHSEKPVLMLRAQEQE